MKNRISEDILKLNNLPASEQKKEIDNLHAEALAYNEELEKELLRDTITDKVDRIIRSKVSITENFLSFCKSGGYNAKTDLENIHRYIKKGANINARDEDGNTALLLGVGIIELDAVEFLIQNGADISAVNNDGKDVLDIAHEKQKQDLIALIRKYQRI